MAIQVLKDDVAQSINDIDKMIADYWGVPYFEKQYAAPLKRPKKFNSLRDQWEFISRNYDWFNSIGLRVHLAEGNINTIDELRNEYFSWMIGQFPLEECMQDEYIRKQWYLLGYLESNNYRIVYVKD